MPPLIISCPHSFFVLSWGTANLLFETGTERGGITKTTGISSFCYRVFLTLK